MKFFQNIAQKIPQFNELVQNIENSPNLVVGLSSIHKAHFSFALQQSLNKQMIIITHDEAEARVLCEDINAMAGEEIAAFYPSRDFNLRYTEAYSREYEQIRLGILQRIIGLNIKIVIASIEAVLQYTIPKERLQKLSLTIDKNTAIDLKELTKLLVSNGYKNCGQVEGVAQFSVRGGIIDIFPPSCPKPIRIELWGDNIDTFCYFDIETQRKEEDCQSVVITPACEVLFEDDLKQKLEKLIEGTKDQKAKQNFYADLQRLNSDISLSSTDKYFSLAYDKGATLFDYFDNPLVVISEYTSVKETAKTISWQQSEDFKQLLEDGEIAPSLIAHYTDIASIILRVSKLNSCFFDTFAHTNNDIAFKRLITINPMQSSSSTNELKVMVEDISSLIDNGYAVAVLAGTEKAANILCQDLKKNKLPAILGENSLAYKKVSVLSNTLSSGMEYPEIKVSVITTAKANDTKKRIVRYKKGKQLRDITDLVKGDYVVHVSHGIGIFEGIQKLELQGVTKDYIKIAYSGSDVLYVPVTQLDLVSKYIGAKDDGKIKLNKLNSTEWHKTRTKVKQAVTEMADELIKLYAQRMRAKGFAYSADTEWQKDFEQHFPYTETDDQLRCVEEIKKDMEVQSPMDRVLCGDVGFGKTEVAMRACFKAVMDSKQVAVLCPTTILAWQHYQSFLKRFESFPVQIEVLSRFRTAKQQKEIIKKLKEGRIDIVIGTHRLVQKDIEFKDLGLAIVDEEQRFGVKHKERFKEMFTNVDMLTLSATPIPRTLNMAISGIRDMSTIEQAPQDRHPVQTYVIEYDIAIIGDAIKKELRRGGQVYYIFNNIEQIELCAGKIQQAVPEARIAVAHGRMSEAEITEIWRQLIEHEIDVLVCTTIIETGVDVANCNTLIIEDADHMGLSQLYQLRGRVGRSNRRAFAYFTFKKGKVLTEIASKRLSAIREFTKFGSGFRIAMRDLEIRGAGNVLGAKQHGHMEAVGYDMYLRLLSEAISAKKGEEYIETKECLIDIAIDAHIPDSYISDMSSRIDIYRRIASIKSKEDSFDVIDELNDRFGEPPASALSLIEVALLRNSLAKYGFTEINQRGGGLMLLTEKINTSVCDKIVKAFSNQAYTKLASQQKKVLVNAGAKPYIMIKGDFNSIDVLREIVDALEK